MRSLEGHMVELLHEANSAKILCAGSKIQKHRGSSTDSVQMQLFKLLCVTKKPRGSLIGQRRFHTSHSKPQWPSAISIAHAAFSALVTTPKKVNVSISKCKIFSFSVICDPSRSIAAPAFGCLISAGPLSQCVDSKVGTGSGSELRPSLV